MSLFQAAAGHSALACAPPAQAMALSNMGFDPGLITR
jgi:hypothetical protein